MCGVEEETKWMIAELCVRLMCAIMTKESFGGVKEALRGRRGRKRGEIQLEAQRVNLSNRNLPPASWFKRQRPKKAKSKTGKNKIKKKQILEVVLLAYL